MKFCHHSEQLSALLDGELRAVEAEKLQNHLLECETCRRSLAMMKEANLAFLALDPTPAGSDFVGRVKRNISPPVARRNFCWSRSLMGLAAAAAVAMILLGRFGVIFNTPLAPPEQSSPSILQTMELIPPGTQPVNIPGLNMCQTRPGLEDDIPCLDPRDTGSSL